MSRSLVALAFVSLVAADWPQFRGPNRDGVSPETGLLKEWPKAGPPLAYTATGLGGGYSGVAVAGGKIYGSGKQADGQEHVFALDEMTGAKVWTTSFAAARKVGYGEGTRSTPTVAGGKVYAVGMGGELVCLDARTGKKIWQLNFVTNFGGAVQAWGYSESVLVDDGKVICTPGSAESAVVALKADTGDVVWQTKVDKPGQAGGYASAVKAMVGGVPMYVTLLGKTGGVVGVDANTGKLLWQYTRVMNGTANIPSVVVRGDLVFCSTGYGDGGSALLKLVPAGDSVKVEELKYHPAKELQNHHGGMVLVGDHLYFGRRHNSGLPTCVEFATGEIQWQEDAGAGGGDGSGTVIAADGMIYFRYQNGVLALVKATPAGFELAGAFKIPTPSGKPSWPHLSLANGRLFVRDQDKLHVFDVRAKGG